MDDHRKEFTLAAMTRVLDVSRSGYDAWRRRSPSVRAELRAEVDSQINAIFVASKERYGSPRIAQELASKGHRIDRKTVAKSLVRQGLVAKAGRRFKRTTNSDHSLPVAENLLKQDFSATQPNEKWVGDITYLWTDEGWLYLATMIDLYSRKVVGWSLSDRMQSSLVCDALQMALWRRKRPRDVIVHSDRGSQYCSHAYRDLISRSGMICSMSGTGNCYDCDDRWAMKRAI